MNWLRSPFVTSLGIATVILTTFLQRFTGPLEHGLLYHWPSSSAIIIVPLLLIICGTWFLLSAFIFLIKRHHKLERFAWAVLGVIVFREALEAVYWFAGMRSTGYPRPVPHSLNVLFVFLTVTVLFFSTVTPLSRSAQWRQMRAALITMLGFIAFSGAFTILQLVIILIGSRHLNDPSRIIPPQHTIATAAPKSRVLWIILDELSYRQLYEHRYPGLELPEFDRLASTSTVFTNVKPAGLFTQAVIPALIMGIPDENIGGLNHDIHVPYSGYPLSIRNGITHRWQRFDPQDTVFHDALADGYHTAVVGFYNPYCRILPGVLDRCYWNGAVGFVDDIPAADSISQNLKLFLKVMLAPRLKLLHVMAELSGDDDSRQVHQQVYLDTAREADSILDDRSITFAMLHLPIPHPYGIYDRIQHKLSTSTTSYIDNLALTDLFLTHLREKLQANGTWDKTTLVIMGDHSWRVTYPPGRGFGWSSVPNWTKEETIASDGKKFDPRPGYLVKLAGDSTPASIATPFDAARTRTLLDHLLDGSITTTPQLVAWASNSSDDHVPSH